MWLRMFAVSVQYERLPVTLRLIEARLDLTLPRDPTVLPIRWQDASIESFVTAAFRVRFGYSFMCGFTKATLRAWRLFGIRRAHLLRRHGYAFAELLNTGDMLGSL